MKSLKFLALISLLFSSSCSSAGEEKIPPKKPLTDKVLLIPQKAEEKDYSVILDSVGTNPSELIPVLQKALGVGADQAAQIVKNLPNVLKKDVSKLEGVNIIRQIQEVGGKASLRKQ